MFTQVTLNSSKGKYSLYGFLITDLIVTVVKYLLYSKWRNTKSP